MTSFGGRPLFTLERAAVPFFGTKVLFVSTLPTNIHSLLHLASTKAKMCLQVQLSLFFHFETSYIVLLTEKSINRFNRNQSDAIKTEQAYGVHMNGYVQVDGEKYLWVAKRSATKQTFPGMLDHLVAGGQVRSCPTILFLPFFVRLLVMCQGTLGLRSL